MDEKTLRKHREKLDKALAANRDDEAIKLLAVLVGAEPTNARWPHKRGDLLRKVGRRPEAVASYEQAVDVYAKSGFIARAVAMAKTVLSLDPSRTDVLARVDPQAAQDLHRKSRPGSILPAPRSTSQSGSGAAKHPALLDDDAPQPSAATAIRKHPMLLDEVAAAEASPPSAPAQSEVDDSEEITVEVEEEPAEEEGSERPTVEEDDDLAAALAEANRHATVLADDDEPAADSGAPKRHVFELDEDEALAPVVAQRRAPVAVEDAAAAPVAKQRPTLSGEAAVAGKPQLSSEAAAALAAAKRRPTLTGEAAAALAAAKKRSAAAEPKPEPRAPAPLTQPIVLDEEDEATAVAVEAQQPAESDDAAATLAAAEREAKLAGEAAAALAAAKRRSALVGPKAEPRAPAPLTQPIVLDDDENVPATAVAGGAANPPSGLKPAQPGPVQPTAAAAAAPSPVAPPSAPSVTAQGGAARGRVAPPPPPTAVRPKGPPPPIPGQPRPKPQPLTEPLTLDRLSLPPTSEEQVAANAGAPSDLQPLAATTAANDTAVAEAQRAVAVDAAAGEVALPDAVAAGSSARQPTATGEISKPAGFAGAAGAAFGAKQPAAAGMAKPAGTAGAAGAAFGAKPPMAAGAAKPAGLAGGEAAGAAFGAKPPAAAGAAKPVGIAGGGGAGAFGAKQQAVAGVAEPAGGAGPAGAAAFEAQQPAAAGAAKPTGVAGGEGAGAFGTKQQPAAAGAAKPTGVAGGEGAGAFGALAAGAAKPAGVVGAAGAFGAKQPAAAGAAKPAGVAGGAGAAFGARPPTAAGVAKPAGVAGIASAGVGSPAAAAPSGARPAPAGIGTPPAATGAAAPLTAARPLGAVPPAAAGLGGPAGRGPAAGLPVAGAGAKGAPGAAVAGAKPPPLGSPPGASTVARGGGAAPAAPPTAAASASDNSHSGQLWADRSGGQELPVAPVNSVQPSRHRGPTMLGAGPRIKPYEPPADEAELFSRALEAAIELKVAPDVKPNETRFSDAPPSPGVELSTAEVSDRPPAALHEEHDAIPRAAGDLSNLPLFPLFAEMPQEVLATMIQDTELIELSDGDAVVRKGDPGDALYGIVEGSVAVGVPNQTHTLTLAEGDVFGESCLLQDEPRHADVRVIGRLTALKIPRQVLLRTLRGYPKLAELLLELLTRRLLGNLLQTSPLFSEFDAEARRELSRMFEVRRAPVNTRLAIAGKRMDGLYISLTGTLLVETPGQEPRIVTPGSMFGQHTLLSQEPSPSSVTARVNLVVLRLPGAAFAHVAMQYPTVVERLAELSTGDVVSVGL